ncbi:MAG: rod shape-determining protein RodA [Candidatus Eiseniibacteriota bacterium]
MAIPLVDRRALRQLDWVLIAAVLGLAALGIALVYSATSHPGSAHPGFHLRQLSWLGIGVVCAYIVAALHYRAYDTLAWFGYAVSMVLLVLVFFVGIEVYGAKRWLGVGSIRFQPSEIAKLFTILLLARHLDQHRLDLTRARNWIIPFFITAVPMALVMKEPDLATSLSFFVFFVAMMFWAGMPLSSLVLALSPVLSVVLFFLTRSEWPFVLLFLVILAWARPRMPMLILLLVVNGAVLIGLPHIWNSLEPYQRGRIETFLNPGEDPTGAGYQVIQSQIAIGSGGALGRGYLEGTQKGLQFLPQKHTDFIFSVLGEELGFWGTALALLLFAIVVFRGLWIAQTARNAFASLVAVGVVSVFFYHVLVNILMTLGWAPVAGVPLPLLSYGGTALVMNCLQIGLLLNIGLRRHEY